MRVLVTGATGFIGRNLCRVLLQKGHQVRALLRPTSRPLDNALSEVEVVLGDVTVPESLPQALENIEAVVHLAGVKQAGQVSLYRKVNAEGTAHLAQACNDLNLKHFIFMSSLSAQGPSPQNRPHIDPGNEAPINAYAQSKLNAEKAILDCPDLRATILRPGIVYGPGDAEILAWAKMVRRRIAPLVPNLELSFMHVDDLTQLIAQILEREDAPLGPYFLSDGQPLTMNQLIDLLERLFAKGPVLHIPLPPRMLAALIPAIERIAALSGVGPFTARRLHQLAATGWACSPNKAQQELDYVPQHRFAESLPAVLDWYKQNGWFKD